MFGHIHGPTRRFATQRSRGLPSTSPLHGGILDNDNLAPNIALRKTIEEWETKFCKLISSSNVTILEQIGIGSFKKVHRAELRMPGSDQDHPTVRQHAAAAAAARVFWFFEGPGFGGGVW